MDAYEATKIVFQRIQCLDPENASKIMGILLLQDHGEKEMIRLAFGPESLVQSVILRARKDLGLASSNTPSTPSSHSPSHFSNPLSLSRTNSSSRLLGGVNFPSPLSMPKQSSTAASSWANSSFSDFKIPDDLISPGSAPVAYNATSPSATNSAAPPFYATGEVDLIDELHLQDHLSFLNDGSPSLMHKSPDVFYTQQDLGSSPSGNGDEEGLFFPSFGGAAENWGEDSVNGFPHRRSCSASDICFGPDDLGGGFGWKPCLYFARGYCKNGTSCRFVHGENGVDGAAMVGSPSQFEMEQCQELLRSKFVPQQRLAAASSLVASTNFPYSPVATNRGMDFLLQQQLQAESPRAFMGDDMHKFSRSRLERGDFGMINPGSRQIYLTFPADSTFKEEDVSNYFSIYGLVQDVRIPYQQKRMFGFVTFVYPETVKLILAKGNPHFVCDARVLVKPYKEKGKIPDKYRKQPQMERGEYTGNSSPTGLESRDLYDLQLGVRMFYNNPDMLWRRKLEEQADLQQAIELQNRRLMSLQLLDMKRTSHHQTLSTGGVISSQTHSPSFSNQNNILSGDRSSPESKQENVSILAVKNPVNITALESRQTVNVITDTEKQSFPLKDENSKDTANPNKENDLQESLEHNLPDSPFASPNAAGDYPTAFSMEPEEADKVTLISASSPADNSLIGSSLFPAGSSLDMAPYKSCYFQVPRFASGHETIGM
ncbi:zinc finger CCCH domain-containing protein 53-like isoform X1 [Olea europaea var. sylvestris]|uniref:zinc finger CCCH domain-containing protein 53-like isoform X1 n=1 Tax=Olea europaea var. sylvestris TaxID=158386 RepID=UPI000C1D5ABB|nr:zinc finger CCCH domain-containing protein 53-like isoform X1 [Olea europaea var. sylvestris]XP_022896589.1 zinc finger CCCH domain-containing protein 53-like isoform X1 [Olea europaea var. sylvestris]XP_022896590.1 zinc finger CCCH domain-containing protein 53-like isoform X1 [Olea europaea var. sylvestris]